MTQQISASHLVYTKLNQPRVTTQLVERKRLYKALNLQRPLAIVVAPAGYGKTTLVSSWASESSLPCSWLSLDPGDNQLSVFVDYFLAAVERLYPDVTREAVAGVSHGAVTSFAAVARKLADALDDIDERFTIILDDYHFIVEADIHRFLAELLRFPPRGLNLVISSRAEPPLPVAALRARAQLAEIRTHDLRFTFDEAADYLQRALNQAVDVKTVALVEESAEGWVAGLHLAVLYLQRQSEPSVAAAHLSGHNRFTADYLALEVLANLGPPIQEFLLKTSILPRMCPALCDAVLAAGTAPGVANGAANGATDGATAAHSRRMLDYLDSHNLFITTLDDSQQWYRYHHLFQQLLEARLRATYAKDTIAELHRTASRWCADQGLIDEAIAYSTAAGDMTDTIVLIESHRHAAMNDERWQQLERWLNLLQRQQIDRHAELLLLEAWVLHKRQRLSEIPARLDLAAALLTDGSVAGEKERHLYSEIDALRSQQYFDQPDAARAYQAARRALDHAPRAYASVRGLAWVYLGAGRFLTDGKEQALAELAESLSRGRVAQGYEYARLLMIRCFVDWMAADMPNMERTAAELLRYAQQRDLPESTIWAQYFHGCACYQQNDLAAAYDDFLAVMQGQHIAPGFVAIQGPIGFALVLQAQGQAEAAGAAVATVLEYAQLNNNDTARQTGLAFGAALALRQERPGDAAQWVAGAGHLAPPPVVALFAPPLAVAAILLQQGTQAAANEAEQMLGQMETYLAAAHVDRLYVEVLALQALLYAGRGQRDGALAVLARAVTFAQRGNLQRVFLDFGPGIQHLLAALTLDGERGAFVRRLCAAAPAPAETSVRASAPPQAAAGTAKAAGAVTAPRAAHLPQPRHPDLIELLTNRELEVLHLLALRLTNKEIADALGISTGTVKQHTINLFRKLHVQNRREAIQQARAMGFQIETPYPV